jgi:peptidase E
VGGGSVVSLLGVWHAHGIDLALHDAWHAGVVLCGGSAGSLCWFAESVSGFHAGEPRRIRGLGFLPCSNAVHYEQERGRRAAYREAIADGMQAGYAAGDGAALHFVGTELAEAISSRPDARAYFVSADARGRVRERMLAVRLLDRPAALAAVAA